MGVVSDLHLLSGRVLDGESVESVASGSAYDKEEIEWAVVERLSAESDAEVRSSQ